MKTKHVKIRKGLMQMKNLLQGLVKSRPQTPMAVSSPTLVSAHGRSTTPPPVPPRVYQRASVRISRSSSFYGERSEPGPYGVKVPLASPNNVPVADSLGYGLVDGDPIDEQINDVLQAVETGVEPERTAPNPLAVEEDLRYYEEFASWEKTAFQEFNRVKQSNNCGMKLPRYFMEKQWAAHRCGYLMGELIMYFKENHVRMGINTTFTEFITQLTEEQIKNIWKVENDSYYREYIRRFQQGVRYLSPEKREKYNVGAQGGKLYWAKWGTDKPLDTTAKGEFFKRKHQDQVRVQVRDEIAIWVLSTEQKLYTHAAKLYRFHHSSFVNGDVIICAGEWSVKGGQIEWISGASGHYKPTFDDLREAVLTLQKVYNVAPKSYLIKCKTEGKRDAQFSAAYFLENFAAIKDNHLVYC